MPTMKQAGPSKKASSRSLREAASTTFNGLKNSLRRRARIFSRSSSEVEPDRSSDTVESGTTAIGPTRKSTENPPQASNPTLGNAYSLKSKSLPVGRKRSSVPSAEESESIPRDPAEVINLPLNVAISQSTLSIPQMLEAVDPTIRIVRTPNEVSIDPLIVPKRRHQVPEASPHPGSPVFGKSPSARKPRGSAFFLSQGAGSYNGVSPYRRRKLEDDMQLPDPAVKVSKPMGDASTKATIPQWSFDDFDDDGFSVVERQRGRKRAASQGLGAISPPTKRLHGLTIREKVSAFPSSSSQAQSMDKQEDEGTSTDKSLCLSQLSSLDSITGKGKRAYGRSIMKMPSMGSMSQISASSVSLEDLSPEEVLGTYCSIRPVLRRSTSSEYANVEDFDYEWTTRRR